MSEEQFILELNKLGYSIDCQNGKDLKILKGMEEVARVSAFETYKMNTLDSPLELLKIIVDFSSVNYEDRFL